VIHVSYTDLRKNLAHDMDRANDDRDAILITRQGSEPVVMVAQSEWEGMLETLHLQVEPGERRTPDALDRAGQCGGGDDRSPVG
jgi:prevent-host-death family protein